MPSGKKAPRELRDRAVRLTMEARADSASMAEALRKWSCPGADLNRSQPGGPTSEACPD